MIACKVVHDDSRVTDSRVCSSSMMKIFSIVAILILAGCGGRYGRGLPTDRASFEAWAAAQADENRVAPEMKRLDPLLGKWDFVASNTRWPGAEPITWTGTVDFKRQFDGRWIFGDIRNHDHPEHEAAFMMLGYSNAERRYLTAFLGDFSTSAVVGEGVQVPDRSGNFTIEFEMAMPDPMEPGERILTRRTMRFNPDGSIALISYRSGWNGTLDPYFNWTLRRRSN